MSHQVDGEKLITKERKKERTHKVEETSLLMMHLIDAVSHHTYDIPLVTQLTFGMLKQFLKQLSSVNCGRMLCFGSILDASCPLNQFPKQGMIIFYC